MCPSFQGIAEVSPAAAVRFYIYLVVPIVAMCLGYSTGQRNHSSIGDMNVTNNVLYQATPFLSLGGIFYKVTLPFIT
jgi:hypothetical protein